MIAGKLNWSLAGTSCVIIVRPCVALSRLTSHVEIERREKKKKKKGKRKITCRACYASCQLFAHPFPKLGVFFAPNREHCTYITFSLFVPFFPHDRVITRSDVRLLPKDQKVFFLRDLNLRDDFKKMSRRVSPNL